MTKSSLAYCYLNKYQILLITNHNCIRARGLVCTELVLCHKKGHQFEKPNLDFYIYNNPDVPRMHIV